MWNNNDPCQTVVFPPRNGFLTPSPASSNSKPSFSPMSETKYGSPTAKRDLFHVIHKVPAGDSPYVRAKHVQLIEKDPGRAISLFWSAINAGDRVDSALKDMAIVMKQLDRSDEAIEAVKSFRHLCPVDSQDSLDNVLVELYKRAGRTEEEIEMLERKLKRIDEGSAFSGRRTKTARSQGKKVHITLHEEKSRILGNLAWAYLQQKNYKAAEKYYRKALSFEPDKNKQCNLAICLMSMNRLPEAKSVLCAVKNSCGTNLMDESFARSFERAWEMLVELDPSAKTEDMSRNIPRREETSDEFYCGNNFENKSKSCDDIPALGGMSRKYLHQQPVTVDQLKSGFFRKRRAEPDTGTSWRRNTEPQPNSSLHRKERSSPSLFTQPRRCLWRSGAKDPKRSYSSDDDDWQKKGRSYSADMGDLSQKNLSDEEKCPSSNRSLESSSSSVSNNNITKKKKSWADMAEEEEDEFDFFESPWLQTQMKMTKEESLFLNDENVNCNVFDDHHHHHCMQTQMRGVAQNFERFGVSNASPKSQPLSVRRSLFSEPDKGKNIRLLNRNRLKVFQDITQSP